MRGTAMSTEFRGRFPHSTGPAVDGSVYDRYTGRWSQLFAPLVLEAAAVERGPPARCLRRTREAARMALPIVGAAGCVMGVDISPAMLGSARARLRLALFWPVAADGQALPFGDASVDAVVYQLGLQFCPEPARGLGECRRVLRRGGRVAVCVISTGTGHRWG